MSKKYKFKPRLGIWGLLTLLTIGLGIAVLVGAPISPLWILAPLGIPIALMIAVPLYVVLAIIVLALIVIILVLIGLIPCALLAIVFGIKEAFEDYI